MTEDDSFMQIVRERLGGFDFLESQKNEGLFFNSFLIDGETFYVDMRKKPMRMYGYKKVENNRDIALDQEYVDKMLVDVRRELSSIGCDLKQHGFDQLPEPKVKEKPEIITKIAEIDLTINELENILFKIKQEFQEQINIDTVITELWTERGSIELITPRPEIKKSDQKTVDTKFF